MPSVYSQERQKESVKHKPHRQRSEGRTKKNFSPGRQIQERQRQSDQIERNRQQETQVHRKASVKKAIITLPNLRFGFVFESAFVIVDIGLRIYSIADFGLQSADLS